VRAEVRDDIDESAGETVELATRHRTKERARKNSVVAFELSDQLLAFWCERHERRSSIRRVGLACHEAAFDERVDESRHRPWRHLQRIGEDTLGRRPALAELPKQMGARGRQIERLDRLRHVVVQQYDELEDAIKHGFILLYLVYSEG